VIVLRADAQIQSAGLLAATLVRSATADFMSKECVTALFGKNLLGTHGKSDASIPDTPNNGERR
jgi:hypothetical protein